MRARALFRDTSAVLGITVRVLDAVLVLLSALVAYAWRMEGEASAPGEHYWGIFLFGALLGYALFPSFGLYRSWRGARLIDLVGRVLLAWGAVLVVLLGLLFLAKQGASFSRLWFAAWAVLGALALVGLRLGLHAGLRWMRRKGWNRRRVLLVGTGPAACELLRRMREESWTGFDPVAVVDPGEGLALAQGLEGVPVISGLDALGALVERDEVREVWIVLPLREEDTVREVLHRLRHVSVNIRYAPDIFGLRLLNHAVSDVLGLPMLDLSATPMTGINRVVKAVEDRVFAALILLLISPLMLLIALGVKLSSPGPVLFRQMRHGWDGRMIEIYKFRSMKPHDENEGEVTQAKRADPRVTRFGAFLRRTSLDELPQFINVLQGRMSIVGPRPHAVAHNEQYKDQIDQYMLRHRVKPGITGWAQVNGFRGETDTLEKMRQRVEYDLYYIEHWSLWFDVKIILLTLVRGFVHRNAY
ncbi:MAG: undecaprenyl-phosphate glucose phosphotransferase [Halothiobacillaceae bacterium]|nr:undecaprenyl-phosphate glucose phosphotransferase [Halothiobacillaceae bacterium]